MNANSFLVNDKEPEYAMLDSTKSLTVQSKETLNMKVPEEIIVLGHNLYRSQDSYPIVRPDQFYELKAPEEISIENFSKSADSKSPSSPESNVENFKKVVTDNQLNRSFANSSVNYEDLDQTKLYQTLARLDRRVKIAEVRIREVERKNSILTYIGVLYFAFKFISWFRK